MAPRSIPILTAGAVGGAAVWCGPGLAVHVPAVAKLMGVPRRLERREGVALTFDDGPHPEGTPEVLKALRQANATATFFLVGEQVERHPNLARRIVAEGHTAAVHGYRHRNQMRLTPRALGADLDRALEVIASACGQTCRFYRPPYGIFTPAGLAVVRGRELDPLLWSKWGRDWRASRAPAEIAALATNGVTAGDVILLHDADWYSSPGSHRQTAAALPHILAVLAARALRTVTPGA